MTRCPSTRCRVLLGSLLALALLAPAGAQALPVILTVDEAATDLVVTLTSGAGTDSAAFDVSGSVAAEVGLVDHPDFGPVVDALQLVPGPVTVAHAPLALFDPAFSLGFTLTDAGATLAGPVVAPTPVATGFSIVDFRDFKASVDQGAYAVIGSFAGEPVDAAIDLSALPFVLDLPLGSVGTIETTPGAGGAFDLEVIVPVDATTRIFFEGVETDLSLTGSLALTGTVIPEPGTGLLMGLGLGWMGRRRASRRG